MNTKIKHRIIDFSFKSQKSESLSKQKKKSLI